VYYCANVVVEACVLRRSFFGAGTSAFCCYNFKAQLQVPDLDGGEGRRLVSPPYVRRLCIVAACMFGMCFDFKELKVLCAAHGEFYICIPVMSRNRSRSTR
jgi:hypothetical protein